jgi:hypothetical protein
MVLNMTSTVTPTSSLWHQAPNFYSDFLVLEYEYRIVQIIYGVAGLLIQHSDILVYLTILLNTIATPSIVSLFYPFSLFCYALLEDPKPNKVRPHGLLEQILASFRGWFPNLFCHV